MALTLIADHRAAAVALLLEQHKKPAITAVVDALIGPMNEIESTTIDMLDKRISIDASEGVQLDAIGELLRTPRQPAVVDADYRIELKRQVLINKSKGRGDDLIAVSNDIIVDSNVGLWQYEDAPLEFEAIQRRRSDGVLMPWDGGAAPAWTEAEHNMIFRYLNRARAAATYFVLLSRDQNAQSSGQTPFAFDGKNGATFDDEYNFHIRTSSAQPITPE